MRTKRAPLLETDNGCNNKVIDTIAIIEELFFKHWALVDV